MMTVVIHSRIKSKGPIGREAPNFKYFIIQI